MVIYMISFLCLFISYHLAYHGASKVTGVNKVATMGISRKKNFSKICEVSQQISKLLISKLPLGFWIPLCDFACFCTGFFFTSQSHIFGIHDMFCRGQCPFPIWKSICKDLWVRWRYTNVCSAPLQKCPLLRSIGRIYPWGSSAKPMVFSPEMNWRPCILTLSAAKQKMRTWTRVSLSPWGCNLQLFFLKCVTLATCSPFSSRGFPVPKASMNCVQAVNSSRTI